MIQRHQSQQRFSLINRLYNRQIGLIQFDNKKYGDNHQKSSKILSNLILDENIEFNNTYYYKDLFGHYGCVNTVEFSNDGKFLISGGDDKRILIWHIWDAITDNKYKPRVMCKEHSSNIFCLSFDKEQQRIYSGGNDDLVIVHNIETGDAIDVISHTNDVFGISVNPTNNNIFASASDEIRIWDLRQPLNSQNLQSNGIFHGVQYNPVQPHMIATASAQSGIELFDLRHPLQKLSRFFPSYMVNSPAAMCVHFNRSGDKILTLGRKLPPVLYDIRSPYPQLLFEGDGFYNYCTLKNCSFAGQNDQYVISGSDNFYIYMWKIPDTILNNSWEMNPLNNDSTQFVSKPIQILSGHRSIVNQVRYSHHNSLIVSTGVEKKIRLWSPLIHFNESNANNVNSNDNDGEDNRINSKLPKFSRDLYSYSDYINEFDATNGRSNENNVEEDVRLIAYFDRMLKHDISFSSYSSSDDDNQSFFEICDYTITDDNYDDNSRKNQNNDSEDNDDSELIDENDDEYVSTDFQSDIDEKFHVQNHYDFKSDPHNNYNTNNTDIQIIQNPLIKNGKDYLHVQYSRRMYIRYLKSVVNILIQKIEAIRPELIEVINEHNNNLAIKSSKSKQSPSLPSSSMSEVKSNKTNENIQEKQHQQQDNNQISILTLLKKSNNNFRTYDDLYRLIQIKKKYKLLLQSFRMVSELYGALRSCLLFKRPYNNNGELNLRTIINFLRKSNRIEILAKKLSNVEGRKLCDRKLRSLIVNFYSKKILHLAEILFDVKCFINVRDKTSNLFLNPPIVIYHKSTKNFLRNLAEIHNGNDSTSTSSDSTDIIDWDSDNLNDSDDDNIEDNENNNNNHNGDDNMIVEQSSASDSDDIDVIRRKKKFWALLSYIRYSDLDDDDDDSDSSESSSSTSNYIDTDNDENNQNKNEDESKDHTKLSPNDENSKTLTKPKARDAPSTSSSSSSPHNHSPNNKSIKFKKIENFKNKQRQPRRKRISSSSSSSSSSTSMQSSPKKESNMKKKARNN